jgi:trimeric autotransporter adhesin
MTINRSTLLDLPLPVTGTEDGTWGDVTNNGLTQYLDIAIAGMVSLTSTDFTAGALTIDLTEGDSSATNIANDSAQYSALKVSSLAQNSTITAPGSNRAYKVINSDSTYSLTIKASGQTGVTFAPGTTGIVAFNGTDYEILGVVGPASATDNAVPKFDGTTGQIIQGSGVTIDDSNNVSGVAQLNATTADLTNLEVTNIKAKDGTASATITDSTGAFTISTELSVDNININGNTIVSSDTDGDLNLTPNGTGDLVLDGLKWPQADGTADYVLKTDGSGQLSWTEQTGGGGGGTSVTVTQATATAAQTDFSVTYTVGQLSVYLNGALLASADYTASNGTTVVLASGAALNDIFTAVAYSTVAGLDIESSDRPFMTAVGSGAGAVNTGTRNVFVGFESGNDNTSAGDNTAVGAYSLDANTTGGSNNAFGVNALGANTTGANNVAVGSHAMGTNTTGVRNVAMGHFALYENVSGNYNTAIGYEALNISTASNNTAVGYHCLVANTTGASNTAVGYQALDANTTGTLNTAVGVAALTTCTTGSSNTAVGYAAMATASTGTDNSCFGKNAGENMTTGIQNTLIGSNAGQGLAALTTGSNNVMIGMNSYATAGAVNQIVIGTDICVGQGDNYFTFGKTGNRVYNQYTVDANWARTSDGRLKRNVNDMSLGLSFVNKLRPVSYQWKPSYEVPQELVTQYNEENKMDLGVVMHGFIAQEVKAALDEVGSTYTCGVWSEGSDGTQAVSREMFIMPHSKGRTRTLR